MPGIVVDFWTAVWLAFELITCSEIVAVARLFPVNHAELVNLQAIIAPA